MAPAWTVAALISVLPLGAQEPDAAPPLPQNWCGVARGMAKPESRPTTAKEATPAEADPRQAEAEALAQSLAPDGGVDGILRLLNHANPDVREIGLRHVPTQAGQATTLRPGLLNLLRDPRPGVRSTGARALGLLGSGGGDVSEALLALLHDAVPVAENAIWALGQLGTPGATRELAALSGLLPAKSIVIRNQVLESLAAYSPLDAAVQARVLSVLPLVQSVSWEGDAGTDVLLARLCQLNPALLHEVMLTLVRGTEEQRRGAIRTLGQLDPSGPEVARLVATQLRSESSVLREDAQRALQRMGPLGQEYVRGVRRP